MPCRAQTHESGLVKHKPEICVNPRTFSPISTELSSHNPSFVEVSSRMLFNAEINIGENNTLTQL
jgi:hypothetical protein